MTNQTEPLDLSTKEAVRRCMDNLIAEHKKDRANLLQRIERLAHENARLRLALDTQIRKARENLILIQSREPSTAKGDQ